MNAASRERVHGRSLNVEESRITSNLNALCDAQESAEDSDAIRAFLLGLPLSSMSGRDKDALVDVAKGRLDAIEMVLASKGCE